MLAEKFLKRGLELLAAIFVLLIILFIFTNVLTILFLVVHLVIGAAVAAAVVFFPEGLRKRLGAGKSLAIVVVLAILEFVLMGGVLTVLELAAGVALRPRRHHRALLTSGKSS